MFRLECKLAGLGAGGRRRRSKTGEKQGGRQFVGAVTFDIAT